MKKRGLVVYALATLVAAAFAATAGAGSSTVNKSQACELQEHAEARHGHAAHRWRRLHRHRAAHLGEVRGRRRLARSTGSRSASSTATLPLSRVPRSLRPLAQKMIADKSVVAVIGPSTSGAVAASSQAYFDAGMAHISSSATRTSLTKGATKEATSSFFRVVPGDYIQGPTDARFMVDKLKAEEGRPDRLPGAVLAGSGRRC